MVLAILHWWWDATLGLPRAQVVVGLISIVIGMILSYAAWRISRRQMEMQAEQHAFFREERGKRPNVVLWVTGIAPFENRATRLTISARNGGKAPADGFSWEIVLPSNVESFVHFREENNKPTPYKQTADMVKHFSYFKKGIHSEKLFVGDMVDVAWIFVERHEFESFEARWRVYGEY